MSNDRKLTVLGHISELRRQLVRCVIVLFITTVASFIFAKQMEGVYQQPRFAVVASERYSLASQIARAVQSQTIAKTTLLDRHQFALL